MTRSGPDRLVPPRPSAVPAPTRPGRLRGFVRPFFRRRTPAAALAFLLGLPPGLPATSAVSAAEAPPAAAFARVAVAPARTSIYVGSVALAFPDFVRRAGGYEADYTARVFPFAFYNETGTIRIEFPDADLARLARGEPVDFTGRARRTDGAERPVAGRAPPGDARSGRIKVRVFYSRRIELIFNTSYAFPAAAGPAPAAPAAPVAP